MSNVVNGRSAGVLMHLTSLAGPAYMGDLGPAAQRFADFLFRSKQSFWQLLPIQPTSASHGWSPYSSSSSMATNPLLISPELLVEEGLIDPTDVVRGNSNSVRADFQKAQQYKQKLLDKAWLKWNKQQNEQNEKAFNQFCNDENYWLGDYSLYQVLKSRYNDKPWFDWPPAFRDRQPAALRQFEVDAANEIAKVKWVQMIFHHQWHDFRSYCDALNIRLIGDVPIYVAHDSADVWSNREIFTLNPDGSLSEVAGVPPDLFNDNGQLWGMPLFRWDVLKQSGYSWWFQRLQKNLSLFDVVRLDHFRGFSSYWSVPASSATAKSGEWKPGPGRYFFDAAFKRFEKEKFIAEDLGDIDDKVHDLRDALNLPGMNVLQFAFNDDFPDNNYLPHNHVINSVVYTGTHDNNTTKGWYNSLSPVDKKNASAYFGVRLNANNASEHFCRMAYMSVAKLAILPLQDILSLGEGSRMNMPATADGNWTWRIKNNMLTSYVEDTLSNLVLNYGRQGTSS